MKIEIREFCDKDITQSIEIWNDIVEQGIAFPQTEILNQQTGKEFFRQQSFTGAAFDDSNHIVGLYILHPNNIGRCGHICNASYAVKSSMRGHRIGERLVCHSMDKGKDLGFKILQFNAVVSSNVSALALYKKLGFTQLGVIPKGFQMKNGEFEDIIPHYITL
ncbi:MAG: GNAT family N-acetyltransferase [Lacrimispora celerecrescens]|nr:GNAT family N-acetyltransferase [Lacrimispora celerecrescens]